MNERTLKHTDTEDIEDLLGKVESSFGITFSDGELIHIKTFGELCDHVTNKIQLDNADDCTTQQAFYKLRNAITETLKIESKDISPDSLLLNLLPRRSRRTIVNGIEKQLGFKISILRPPTWIMVILAIILITSFIELFFNGRVGVCGLLFSFAGLWVANKVGKELDLKTVGEVAEKMKSEYYLQSRRNSKTFNKQEIEKALTELFSNGLCIDKSELTRNAELV